MTPHTFSLFLRQCLRFGWRKNLLLVLIITQAGTRLLLLKARIILSFLA